MDITKYLTMSEIEEYYQISANTLRAYINRGQVIPKEVYIKKYGKWMIRKDWIDKHYKKRDNGGV